MVLPSVREVIVQHVVSTYFDKHSHWITLFDIHEMQKYMEMYVHGYGRVQKHFVGTTTDRILTMVSMPLLTVKI